MGMGAPCPLLQLKLRGCFGCLLDLQRCVSAGQAGLMQGQLGQEVTGKECVHTQGLGAAAASLMATVLRRPWVKGAQLGEPPQGLRVPITLPDATHPALTLDLCPCPAKHVGTETWETALAQLCGLGDSRAGLPTANTAPGWIMTLGMIAAGHSWSRGQSWAPHGSVLPSETPRAAWPQQSRAPQLMARVMELSTVPWGPALPLCLRKQGGRSGVAGARPSISHSVHGSPAGTGQPGRAEHG